MSAASSTPSRLFRKHLAIPQQHGSWAIWLGPYAAGIGIAGRLSPGLLWLTLASLGAFLALQPLTILVKALAGRRSRADVRPALVWIGVDGLIAAAGAAGLLAGGHGRALWLGLAALPVLIWQMWLVVRRSERGQMGAELAGAGVLALAAPAGFWVAGGAGPTGWWLWLLCWLQAAGAIVYVYLRLVHRRMDTPPARPERLRLAKRALLYHLSNLLIAAALAALGLVPWTVIIAFGAMLAELLYGGLLRPGIGAKPATIGVRQIGVTLVFAALLVLAYRL